VTITELAATIGITGSSVGGAVTWMAKALINSWLKQLEERFAAIETQFENKLSAVGDRFERLEQEQAEMRADQKLSEARQVEDRAALLEQITKLALQVSYMNGQLAQRGLVSAPLIPKDGGQ
jgi:hypothetical protein